MKTVMLDEFAGGMVQGEHSQEFGEETWSLLRGVMVEDSGVVRSQHVQSTRVPFTVRPADVTEFSDRLVFYNATAAQWQSVVLNEAQPVLPDATITALSAPLQTAPSDANPSVVIPANRTGLGWNRALLFNTAVDSATPDPAYLLVDDNGALSVSTVTERFPNDVNADAMPHGEVAVLWGDYLVLGNILWMDNPEAEGGFTYANSRRHTNGLWFSQPGRPLRWDMLDVEFVGITHDNADATITGLLPCEDGLLVLTRAGTWLLRGTPSSHEPFFLSDIDFEAAELWRGTGGLIGLADGDLWFLATSGETQRVGNPYEGMNVQSVVTFRDFAFLSDDTGRLFVGRVLPDRGVAWTEIEPHGEADGSPITLSQCAQGIVCVDDTGMWTLNLAHRERGAWLDSLGVYQPVEVTVGSRTVGSGEVESSLFRTFGAYLRPGGSALGGNPVGAYWVASRSHVGSILSPEETKATTPAAPVEVTTRQTAEWRALAPAEEVSFEIDLRGDVVVESCWAKVFDGGREVRR